MNPFTLPRAVTLSVCLLAAGCSSPSGGDKAARAKGPDGTVAYQVQVETSEPGSRIEVNGEDAGVAPLTLTVFADKDGTFHNFGSFNWTIRAYPVRQGQFLQSKVFKTGGFFTGEDRVPAKIYFDLSLPTAPAQP